METLPQHSTLSETEMAEYQAAREAAAVVDLSAREALRITGSDRVSFLHGMCTNDVNGLPDWGNAYATMVTVKGSMVADLRIIKRPEDLVVDLEPGGYEKVREFLDKYLISEDAELHDARAEFAVVGLVGPRTKDVLKAALGYVEGPTADFEGEKVVLLPSLLTRGEGVDLLVPREKTDAVWKALVDGGATPASLETMELVRVEDGVPRFGQDLLETTIPLEADLTHAIHYKKGCYVGQEVIARATFRGHMNKKLTGLLLGDAPAAPSTELRKDGKKVGFITSVVRSPARGQFIALGYVHRDHLAEGTALEVADRTLPATVQPLPIRRA